MNHVRNVLFYELHSYHIQWKTSLNTLHDVNITLGFNLPSLMIHIYGVLASFRCVSHVMYTSLDNAMTTPSAL